MKKVDKEELFIGLLFPIVFGLCAIPVLITLERSEDIAKSQAIEKYNKVYSVLADEQKHRADSLSPVCTEDEYHPRSCKARTEFLEKLYLSGGDIPQSGLPIAGE